MSHQIYHTEGFIIDRRDLRETDVLLYVYTLHFGLVVARGSGIRQIASKMRQHALPFRYVRVSLVRGREMWRLVGVNELEVINWALIDQSQKELLVKMANLFRYFIHGEEPLLPLFNDLKASLFFLADLKQSDLYLNFECVFALRFLNHLGYVAGDEKLSPFLVELVWSKEMLSDFTPLKRQAVALINRSFTVSGM